MIKKITLFLAIFLSTIGLSLGVAYAQTNTQSVCEGVGLAGGGGTTCADTGGTSVETVIKNVINILSILIGVTAVIMIMFAGFRFITANGDASNVSAARNTVIYAIVGLVVAALAQVIVKFVLNRVTK